MEEDKKLYEEYLEGKEESFNKIIKKYKNGMIYFITRYVKDVEIAEDIFQDVILYILEHKEKYNSKYSLKTYLYTIARSRAINYINRNKQTIQLKEDIEDSNLLEEIICTKERKEKINQVIEKMPTDYQLVIYLTKIEGFSYKEASEVLGKTENQIKALNHNAKKKLKELLVKEKVVEIKNQKIIKLILWIVIASVICSGVVYAAVKIYENITGKAKMTPTYTSQISDIDTNKVWIGTFQLIWNDFMDEVIKRPIEFEDGYSKLAAELNKKSFTKNELSENSYFKIHGETSIKLKNQIEQEIQNRFNEKSQIIDKIDWDNPDGYVLYAMLKKKFSYLEKFSNLPDDTFGDSQQKVKYFGINATTGQEASKNITIMFYNNENDFAIKLKTKENEDVILYKTTGENKSFDEIYQELMEKNKNYGGEENIQKGDNIKIPYINVKNEINYDELCGRIIKGTNGMYIKQALQTIEFELNNVGGTVKGEAVLDVLQNAELEERKLQFDDDFILYLKETDKEKPYFALKVDDIDVLQPAKNEQEQTVNENMVVIKNGMIKNENLIDDFINKVNYSTNEDRTLEIENHISNDEIQNIKLEYKKESREYIYTINDDKDNAKTFNSNWTVKRQTKDGVVNIIFYTYMDVTEFPIICSYNLEGSNYQQKFELKFNRKGSLEIDKIVDGDISVYTFGGDVDIIIDRDMVYEFKSAFEKNAITIDSIIEQAQMDGKYGLCGVAMYKDGGSIEYRYSEYTILKYNGLSGNRDIVVGPPGSIINEFNKMNY